MPLNAASNAFKFTYSSQNQLIKVQITAGTLGPVVKEINYTYDVLGRRMQRAVIDSSNLTDPAKTYGRNYVYDGDNILFEYDTNGSLLARYSHNPGQADDVLSITVTDSGVSSKLAKASGSFYFLKDEIGSVNAIADGSGNIVQTYEYSAFGKVTAIKDGLGNSIAADPYLRTAYSFTGRERDEESGLYFYRARYYDPSIGRFLQKDPDPGRLLSPASINSGYTYALNRPTILRDSNGKFPPLLIAIAVAAIVGGAIGGFTAKDGDFLKGFANGALIAAGSVLAVSAGAALATYGAGAVFGSSFVAAGTGGGIAAGAIGGAIVNTLYYQSLGAKGSGLALAALSGGLSGGIAGLYGGNFGQSPSPMTNSLESQFIEGADSFNRTITPIQLNVDPYSFIHDVFTPTGDGGFTNGAGSGGGRGLQLFTP